MPTSTHNVDGTCYWCVIWFQTFIFPDLKRGGGVWLPCMTDTMARELVLQMQRSVSFNPFYDH